MLTNSFNTTTVQNKMVAAPPPPPSGHHLIHRPKSGRRALEPRNPSTAVVDCVKPAEYFEISKWLDNSNKENIPPFYSTKVKTESSPAEPVDASLADELNAARERLERLRVDKAETDKLLRERGLMLDSEMKEILIRWEVQNQLEIEVDRLYRLKEIRLACVRISQIRSLRDKEEEKMMKQDQLRKVHCIIKDKDERKDASPSGSQNSEAKSWD